MTNETLAPEVKNRLEAAATQDFRSIGVAAPGVDPSTT
jgi:hypothetical protein